MCVWHKCVPVHAVECTRSKDVVVQLFGTVAVFDPAFVGVGV